MSVVSRPSSGKLTVAKMVCILFVFCAATVIASPAQQTLSILVSFTGDNGSNPQSSLVRGTDGNFYGTTFEGGTTGLGTVFKVTPAGTLTTLHSFQGPFSDGASPFASLVQGTDGNFYGTTGAGGTIGIGTVFKITPSGTLTIIHSFNGADGALPESELVQASDGNFYGTTSQTGLNGLGTVFKITPAGTLTTLNSFTQGGSNGSSPYGGLVQATDGNLYGTTYAGGTSSNCTGGCGIIFRMTPSGTLTKLHDFIGTDGARPQASMVQATDGNLYGTTFEGGTNNAGTVFKITLAGTFTSVHSFNSTDGFQPAAKLLQASDGNFYSTTSGGGTRTFGTIFKLTPAGSLTTLYSFQGEPDGANPYGGLVQAPNGSLYGTTSIGGTNNLGTVFSTTLSGTSTTTVTSSPNPSMSGELVTITATVGPAGPPTPTGTVGFTSNGTTIPGCTAVTLNSSRTAVCTTTGLAVGTDAIVATYSGDSNYGGSSGMTSQIVNPLPMAVQFVPVTPCRVVDTRNANGTFGGPPISGHTSRAFPLSEGDNPCGIPASAIAYSLNVTVVPMSPLNFLTIWPTGQGQPTVSTLNSSDGRVKADAAIVPAGTPSGSVSVYVTQTANVILDINGYFIPSNNSTLAFYPLTPCRVVDTRDPHQPQGLGPPTMGAMETRDLPILTSSCLQGVSHPKAYSFNVTVVPNPANQPLNYLTAWPSDQQRPNVSTLNNPTATVVANGAIVPAAASNGNIKVFTTNSTDVVMDINGYFAAPGANGYSFYAVTPCRVYDSRNNNGQPFQHERTVGVVNSQCGPPSSAKAYVFNATVVPQGFLNFLTLWPDGQMQPNASTLNAQDGLVTSNIAIIPTTNGSIDAYASQLTHLILDISGYFAP